MLISCSLDLSRLLTKTPEEGMCGRFMWPVVGANLIKYYPIFSVPYLSEGNQWANIILEYSTSLMLSFSTALQLRPQRTMLLQEAQWRCQSNAQEWNKADFTNPSEQGCTATLALGVWWQQQTENGVGSLHVNRSVGDKAKKMCIFNAQSSTI